MTDPADAVAVAVEEAVRRERLALVATLVRVTRDFDLAEDCVQDAAERALARWPEDGIPDNPAAWLSVAARRRALDVLKRRRVEHEKLEQVLTMTDPVDRDPTAVGTPGPYDDDRLRLLFACCHPALPLAGRVALTLKVVTGLSTREIARAFLVSEATMSQRLLRAKGKIEHAGIALRVPPADQLEDRIDAVLAVVYLLFSEGYSATEGEPLRDALAQEAISLGEVLVALMPHDDEARSLLALMLLQHSRRAARFVDGDLVPIDEQDRERWDRASIDAGLRMLASVGSGEPGSYRLQAVIAALHATAPSAAATDWVRIVRAYDALLALRGDDPVIELNRLVAVSFRDGPETALASLPALDEALPGYPLLPAVRADLLRRAGRSAEAAIDYREAIHVARTDAERRFLARRLAEVGGD
ncbi:MAG: sigma-70 family RNA polymerase sigma factor [Candidatus Limnocylindrales bacterium]